jgi:hypothetical protein
MNAPITPLHTFGWDHEKTLKGKIEASVGRSLKPTSGRFNPFDFENADGDAYLVELKTRPKLDKRGKSQTPDRFDTWLIPTCKGAHAKGRPLTLFYYYEADESLWFITYDEELFGTFKKERPFWHPDRQEHWYIPRDLWTQVAA